MQLHGHIAEIEDKGAKLYLIGNGKPHFIEGFKETTGYTGAIFTDPSLASYNAAGLLRSVTASLGPRSIGNFVKSMFAGQKQGKMQGDPWQQGGVLVMNTKGDILWSQRSSAGGENASASEILAAL